MAQTLRPDLAIAVDTFVSSDSPLERPAFAHAILGKGPVVRAIDSSNITDAAIVERVLALAKQAGLPIQYSLTRGGKEGPGIAELCTPALAVAWASAPSPSR